MLDPFKVTNPMKAANFLTLLLLTSLGAGACEQRDAPVAERAKPASPPAQQQDHHAPVSTPSIAPSSTAVGPQGPATTAAAASWTRVDDASQVCMVNNQFMGRPQIPIAVNGKTYYGCCEMCKTRLGQDPSSRTATDPLTQKSVDKAVAVIAKRADGTVAYFESEQNFLKYTRKN